MATTLLELRVDANGVVSGVRVANAALDSYAKKAGEAEGASKRVAGGAGDVAKAFAAIAGAVSVAAVARKVLETASSFQQLRAQLETVYGSRQRAEATFEVIKKFAAETPFQVQNLTEAWTRLRLTGFEPSIKTMTSLGNVAGAMGKDITEIIDAARGAALGETERLKAFGIAAKVEGDQITLSLGDMSKTVSKDIGSVIGVLEELGNTKFAGGMERQAATYAGAISNVEDALSALADEIGRGGLLDDLETILRVVKDLITDNEELAGVIGGALGKTLRDVAIGGVAGVAALRAGVLALSSEIQGATSAVLSFASRFVFGAQRAELQRLADQFRGFSLEDAMGVVEITADAQRVVAALRAEASAHEQAYDDMTAQVSTYRKHLADLAAERAAAEKSAAAERERAVDQFEQMRAQLDPLFAIEQKRAESIATLTKGYAALNAAQRENIDIQALIAQANEDADGAILKLAQRTETFADISARGYQNIQEHADAVAETDAKQIAMKEKALEYAGGYYDAVDEGEKQLLEDTLASMRARDQEVDGWLRLGDVAISVLGTIDAGWAKSMAGMIRGIQQVADAWTRLKTAKTSSEKAMSGAEMGSGIYGMGQSMGLWSPGGGQSQFGGTNSGNLGGVGAQLGGAIGGQFGPWGALIGSALGGIIGSAIKTGADEGLGQLRMVAGEVSTRIINDDHGLGSVIGSIGDAVRQAFEKIEEATGGKLEFLGTMDFKVRDKLVSVFVNGVVQRFKDVDDAIRFAITEGLRTARFSGLSANQQNVLQWANRQGAGQVDLEDITRGLDLAHVVDQLNLGDVGRNIADQVARARTLIAEALKYGFTDESIAGIRESLARTFATVRESLSRELAALSGTSTEAGDAVAAWTSRVRNLVQGIHEYNAAAAQQSAADIARAAAIREEIAAAQRQIDALRQRGEGSALGGTFTPDGRTAGSLSDFEAAAQAAEDRIVALTAELNALGVAVNTTAMDEHQARMQLIQGSTRLVQSWVQQFIDTPAAAFARQLGQFKDWRDAADEMQRVNLELAQGEQERATAAREHAAALALLDEAESAYFERFKDQTLLGLFQGIADMLQDGPLKEEAMARAQQLQYELKLAELKLAYASLVIAEQEYEARHDGQRLIAQETLDWINNVIGLISKPLPAGIDTGDGGGKKPPKEGGGGGRKDERAAFLDELARMNRPDTTGELGDALRGINDQFDDMRKRAKELHFGKDVLDQIDKLEDAAKKALGAKTAADMMRDIRDNPVADARADLIKKAKDMFAHADELGLDPKLIRRWFHHMMEVIKDEVFSAVESFSDLTGLMGQFAQISTQADELRKSVNGLGNAITDEEKAIRLAAIDAAEEARKQALANQTLGSIFDFIAENTADETERQWALKGAARLKFEYELGMMKAQLEILHAMGYVADDLYNRLGRDLGNLKPPDTATTPANDNSPTSYSVSREIEQMRGLDLPGLFADIAQRANDVAGRIKKLNITEAERAKLLDQLASAEDAANRALADQSVLDVVRSIADMLPDGEMKTQAMAMARQLEYELAMAELKLKYAGLIAANEEYKIKHDGLSLIRQETLDWIGDAIGLIDSMHGPQGGANDGGGGITGGGGPANDNGPHYDWSAVEEAQNRYADFMERIRQLTQDSTSSAEDSFRDLIDQFRELYAAAREFGAEPLVDEALGVQMARFWRGLTQDIRDFYQEQLTGASGYAPISQEQRIADARTELDRLLGLANQGDITATSQVADAWRNLLEQAQAYGTSSTAYGDLYQQYMQQVGAFLQGGVPTGLAERVQSELRIDTSRMEGILTSVNQTLIREFERLRLEVVGLRSDTRGGGQRWYIDRPRTGVAA